MILGERCEHITKACGSPKRIEILIALVNHPHIGYGKIRRLAPMGSSEIYKHLDVLIEHGFVRKKSYPTSYSPTEKGIELVAFLKKTNGIPEQSALDIVTAISDQLEKLRFKLEKIYGEK